MISPCAVCGQSGGELVHQIDSLPVNSCLLVDSAEGAKAIAMGELSVALCQRCGYMGNRSFDESLIAYSDNYEDSQSFSPTFSAYAESLAKKWVDQFNLRGKSVVEIGAGRGDFCRLMIDAGVGCVIAIDPSINERSFGDTRDGRIELRKEWFTSETKIDNVDAVVARHVLEHISKPKDLMIAIYDALDDRVDVPVLIEIPDAIRILKEAAFWDMFYEHCAYFTPDVFRAIMESAGFCVDDVEVVYQDQYLLFSSHVGKRCGEVLPSSQVLEDLKVKAADFQEKVAERVDIWKQKLLDSKSRNDDVVIWGSGSKSTAFLTLVAPHDDAISRIVDINPRKQGGFGLGSGHPIVAPESLIAKPPELVVIMNSIYTDEITKQMKQMGISPEVLALD